MMASSYQHSASFFSHYPEDPAIKRAAMIEEIQSHELILTQLSLLGLDEMDDYRFHLQELARCWFQLKMHNSMRESAMGRKLL